MITLTGNAGDLKLTTDTIPEAVKYVPYAVQILHNNKYSWNTVTLEMISGSLPAGVILKSNGELYGVPKEAGTFTFEVKMTNSDDRFGSSNATYTLEVKENTNINVDASTDNGYDVSKRVGIRIGNDDVVTVITDHEFITEGIISEFVGFWLNGELVNSGSGNGSSGSSSSGLSSTNNNTAGYPNSTLIHAETGVSVTGSFMPGATLAVHENELHNENECAACDEIRTRQANGELIVMYDISVSEYQGNVTVNIPVGAEHDGKIVSILHCYDHVLEEKALTVKDGVVSGTFNSLSPFAVSTKVSESALRDNVNSNIGLGVDVPRTADRNNLFVGLINFAILGVVLYAWRINRRRKSG